MFHLPKALFNRANLALDMLAGKKLDARLLYLLRELAPGHNQADDLIDEIVSLLARGADPNARSRLVGARNATDLSLWTLPAVAQCLLEAGGKPGQLGVVRLVELASSHLDYYDIEPEPFPYATVAELCIRSCPGAKWWYEVPPFQLYYKHTTITRLEFAHPGLAELLKEVRRAHGLQGKRPMTAPVGQARLDDALVRTLKNLEPDCEDMVDDDQRRERVEALLRLGASPNATTKSGRAMGAAINSLDPALVETLLSHGGQAGRQDMVAVLEDRIAGIDHPFDFKLQIDNEKDVQALFNIVARCFPPDFSWDYEFETKDWEDDDIMVNMQSALGNYHDRLSAIQESARLDTGTPEIATSGASRRL